MRDPDFLKEIQSKNRIALKHLVCELNGTGKVPSSFLGNNMLWLLQIMQSPFETSFKTVELKICII